MRGIHQLLTLVLFLIAISTIGTAYATKSYADFGPDTFTASNDTNLQTYSSLYHEANGSTLKIQNNMIDSGNSSLPWYWLDYQLPKEFQVDWNWSGAVRDGTGSRWYVMNTPTDPFNSTRFGFLIFANSDGSGEVKWADQNDSRTSLATLSSGTINIGANNTMRLKYAGGNISFYINGTQVGSNVTAPVQYGSNWKLVFLPDAGAVDDLKITDLLNPPVVTMPFENPFGLMSSPRQMERFFRTTTLSTTGDTAPTSAFKTTL